LVICLTAPMEVAGSSPAIVDGSYNNFLKWFLSFFLKFYFKVINSRPS